MAGQLPSQDIEEAPRLRCVGIEESFAVEMLWKRRRAGSVLHDLYLLTGALCLRTNRHPRSIYSLATTRQGFLKRTAPQMPYCGCNSGGVDGHREIPGASHTEGALIRFVHWIWSSCLPGSQAPETESNARPHQHHTAETAQSGDRLPCDSPRLARMPKSDECRRRDGPATLPACNLPAYRMRTPYQFDPAQARQLCQSLRTRSYLL